MTTTYNGVLSGGGSLTKVGNGTLYLTNSKDYTYTGLTTIEGGTLSLAPSSQNPVFSLGGADIQHGLLVLGYSAGTRPQPRSRRT